MANTNRTHIVFIIDRSGSMGGLVEATRKGFSEFMLEQRNAAGEATATLVLFDDRYEILHDKENVKNIPDINESITLARGTTALRDAIGRSILNTREWITSLDEDERPAKVLFVITTDGADNASTDFDHKKLADAIKFQREVDKWEFLFTGAGEQLVTTAESFGIAKGNTMVYQNSKQGVAANYSAMGKASLLYRTYSFDEASLHGSTLLDDVKQDIDKT